MRAARYTVDALNDLCGESAGRALARGFPLPARQALDGDDSPAAVLARLFVLGEPVRRDLVDRSLPRAGADGAARLGLVSIAGRSTDDEVCAALDLRPYAASDGHGPVDWWIASDLGESVRSGPLGEDHVLGVGGAGLTLAGLTVRREVGNVLDLGTGCGIQALHASRHAGRVVAADVSRRALRLAGLNAGLNAAATAGRSNIDVVHSDLYSELGPERFDLIVSNPPFVITPRGADVPAYDYRDGGLVGDELVERVVRGAAEHLQPGGIAQLLGNWEYSDGADGLDRVAAWIDGTGLDAWVIEREAQDPCEYAETWIRDGAVKPGTGEFDRLYAAWLADFARRRVDAVGFGYILLRRPGPGTRPLRRFERLGTPLPETAALGTHIEQCLRAHDGLLDDVRTAILVRADDVTEERHYWPGSADPTAVLLRQGGGFARSTQVDTATAGFVGACDGELSVGALIEALASILGVAASELSESIVPMVRKFVDDGILGIESGSESR
nr:methyltransferase [Spelaeicoccus albus]